MDEMLIERNEVYYTRDTNKPYSGPVFTLYDNGQLQSEGTVKNGIEVGVWKTYYENGQLESEGTWKDGELIDVKTY